MRVLSFLLLLCVSTFSPNAQAKLADAHVKAFERLALLKKVPGDDLNGFPLQAFLNKSAKVQILPVPFRFASGKNGRNCASNFTADQLPSNLILLSADCVRLTVPKIMPLIMMHELIGVAGYKDDENYEITLMLDDAIAQIEAGSEQIAFPYSLDLVQRKRVAQKDGGTSIVGSGGDTCELFIKRAIFRHFRDHATLGELALRAKVSCQSNCRHANGQTTCKEVNISSGDQAKKTVSGYSQKIENGRARIHAPEFVGRRDFVEANPWIEEFLARKFLELEQAR